MKIKFAIVFILVTMFISCEKNEFSPSNEDPMNQKGCNLSDSLNINIEVDSLAVDTIKIIITD